MTHDLYVYYRVRPSDAPALHSRVLAMQQSLHDEYGMVAQLKRRPEEKDGRQTWMEVYANVPPEFDAALERALAQAGLSALIDGPRHTEVFVDIPACA